MGGPSILQGVQCGIICGDIFREPLSPYPQRHSVLDMGGEALQICLFEEWRRWETEIPMAEVDRWAGGMLRWRQAPEYCEASGSIFHSTGNGTTVEETGRIYGLFDGEWGGTPGLVHMEEFNQQEQVGLNSRSCWQFSVDIESSALLQWYISEAGFDETVIQDMCEFESNEPRLCGLKQMENIWCLTIGGKRKVDAAFTFITVPKNSTPMDWRLKKVCGEHDELLPEPLVEATFENNYKALFIWNFCNIWRAGKSTI